MAKFGTAAWVAEKIKIFGYQLSLIVSALIPSIGLVCLVVIDVAVGGIVLIATFTDNANLTERIIGFVVSAATSALTMLLWSAVAARVWVGVVAFIPALAVTLIDTYIDAKLVIYLVYGEDTMIDAWLLPEGAKPMVIIGSVLIALLTFMNEPCVVFARKFLIKDFETSGDGGSQRLESND